MSGSILKSDKFWPLVMALQDSEEAGTLLSDLLERLEMPIDEFHHCVSLLDRFGYAVKLETTQSGDIFVSHEQHGKDVKVQFGPLEWLALQLHFPLFEQNKGRPVYEFLSKKLGAIEAQYREYDIFEIQKEDYHIHPLNQDLRPEVRDKIETVERALQSGGVVLLEGGSKKFEEVYIHRIVFLEGELTIIAEECLNKFLTMYKVQEISSLSVEYKADYTPNFGTMEVNDFISALRSIEGVEERVILRVLDPTVSIERAYHHFQEPYITTGGSGDRIWAADVEINDDFLEWLLELEGKVDVIDPVGLKEELRVFKKEICLNKKAG